MPSVQVTAGRTCSSFQLRLLGRLDVWASPPPSHQQRQLLICILYAGTNFAALKQSPWSYYMVRCLMEPLKSLWGSRCFIYFFLIKDNPFGVATSLLFIQHSLIFFTPLSLHLKWIELSRERRRSRTLTCCFKYNMFLFLSFCLPSLCCVVCAVFMCARYRKEWAHLPGACAAVAWNGIVSLDRQNKHKLRWKNGPNFFLFFFSPPTIQNQEAASMCPGPMKGK